MRHLLTLFLFLQLQAQAASHVFAVYDTVQQKVIQVVVDANHPEDPSYNPPNCIQVPIDPGKYDATADTAGFIQNAVEQALQKINAP